MTFDPMRPVVQALLYDSSDNRTGTPTNPISVVGAPPVAPPASTAVQLANDTPLAMTGNNTASYVIPNGQTFTLQQVEAGGQGDPTESGSRVEVFYFDGAVERLVVRIYTAGFTVPLTPNTNAARDGTVMVGDGSTKTIRLRRTRLSGGSQEVDAVLRGYVS